MSETLAAAIAAAALGFVLRVADPPAEPPEGMERILMLTLAIVVPASLIWAVGAPSLASGVNRLLMPIGATVLGSLAGRFAEDDVRRSPWRRWIVGACLFAVLASCSLGFSQH